MVLWEQLKFLLVTLLPGRSHFPPSLQAVRSGGRMALTVLILVAQIKSINEYVKKKVKLSL